MSAQKSKPAPSASSAEPHERLAIFAPEFREDLRYWIEKDRQTALRVMALVEAVCRDPFGGVGKPEPLRFALSGAWSRRINGTDHLVYVVSDDRIEFVQAHYHYVT